jgi:2-succinyl-5-enolpyruvyl-6-hydroxy-3-cyclohexene-1-carboxylate synthase
MGPRPEDVQATFAATLVDEWARGGVEHAVVAPGSRSTPLALALAEHPAVAVHVHHDERGAAFLALGLGLATGRPAAVLTTSGTATAELHPAVVEADLARVPMLLCTADRPPELQDVGAPQAIDQTHLFGRAVRWFHAPGVADGSGRGRWRALAARALAAATGAVPGPVHLNLAFREPLLGTAGPLPEPRAGAAAAWSRRETSEVLTGPALTLVDELAGHRGVLVAGPGSGPGPAIDEVARALGWPVLAAPQAPVWGRPGAVVPAADAVLRVAWLADALRPEVVVRLGMPLASKVVGEWLAASGAREVVASGPGRWTDPHGTADLVLPIDPAALVASWSSSAADLRPAVDGEWRRAWDEAGRAAAQALEDALGREGSATEPVIARRLLAALPDGSELVVSSSMPIRDVEWYAQPRPGLRVHANRGANGIDGVLATAVGVALASGRPTAVLLGDLAFLHDATSLVGAARRGVDLTAVVVDNDGGGIFSFLPQAGALDAARFEELFGTPHGVGLVAVARALGAAAREVTDVAEALPGALEDGGVQVLVVRTDRADNVAVHARLHAAVEAALAPHT